MAADRDGTSVPATASNQTLGFNEIQEIGVELVLVRFGQSVGCAGINLQGRMLDEFRRGQCRGSDGDDLVVVTVNGSCSCYGLLFEP